MRPLPSNATAAGLLDVGIGEHWLDAISGL